MPGRHRPGTVPIGAYVDQAVRRRLAVIATREGLTMSGAVREAVDDWLRKKAESGDNASK